MTNLVALLALAAVPVAPSAAIEVHLASPRGADRPGAALTLTLERIGGRAQYDALSETREWPSGVESMELELVDESVWRLRVEGPEVWAPEVLVDLLGEQDPSSVEVTVFPTVPVQFTPRLPGDAELHSDDVMLSFAPVSDRAPPPSRVPCEAMDGGALSCPMPNVPHTRSDLKLRIPGYASHFVWDQAITREGVDLGPVSFVEGASVVGQIESELGPLPAGVTVTAQSAGLATLDGAPDAERETLRGETVSADEEGFFQIRGLAAGNYRLRVMAENFAPLQTEAFALEAGSEAALPDPLVLQRPLELAVIVEPPLDSAGETWRLSLMSVVAGRAELHDRGRTEAGTWRAKPLPAGSYHLMVMDGRGTRVAMEPIDLDHGTRDLLVELDVVAVEGVVQLGDDPLPRARVYFGGRAGMVSVRLETDDEGRFAGVLPKSGEWPVQIEAFGPSVARRLQGVEVEPSDDGRAYVEISLPATVISGEVVDMEGRPVASAHVLLSSAEQRAVQTVTDDGGEFEFHGLEPGTYRAEALKPRPEGTEQSLGEVIELDDKAAATVRLVLRRQRRLSGIAISNGLPAAGVAIRYQSEETPFVTRPTQSGPDGAFELEMPAAINQLTITAMLPGSQLFHQSVPLDGSGDLVLNLEPGPGGTLILPGQNDTPSPNLPRFVTRDGHVRLDVGSLKDWARLNGVRNGGPEMDVLIPGLPAGIYLRCDDASGECSEGFLSPGGELILASPTLSEPQQEE